MTTLPTSGGPVAPQPVGKALAGKYMTFKLGTEEYGLEVLRVREITGLPDLTRVPGASEAMCGVINLRGRVIPVVDLRLKFGMPKADVTEQTVIIVVQLEHLERELTIGVRVDEVIEVMNIAGEQITPPPDFGSGPSSTDFMTGVGLVGGRVIFLLDIARVLTHVEARQQ